MSNEELSMEERWKLAGLTPNMSEIDYCNKLCNEYGVPKLMSELTEEQLKLLKQNKDVIKE